MSFPLTAAPSLSNWELQYNGLQIGNGTPYAVTNIEGLDNPTVRNADIVRPRDHGQFVGLDLLGGRDITITGDFTTDGVSLQSAGKALGAAFVSGAVTELPFWFQFPNLPILCSVARCRKRTTPIDFGYSVATLAKMTILLHATDPRLYGAPQTASVGLPTPVGGMTFPATFPLSFGGGSNFSVLPVVNAGNVEMRPLLVLTGPMTNPTIVNTTAGWSLSFTNPAQTSFTLNAGDTLTIDTDTGHAVTYLASGTTVSSPRRNWVIAGSTWPDPSKNVGGLVPGSNTIEFGSQDSGAVAGTLTVKWASAYQI